MGSDGLRFMRRGSGRAIFNLNFEFKCFSQRLQNWKKLAVLMGPRIDGPSFDPSDRAANKQQRLPRQCSPALVFGVDCALCC